MEGGRVGWYKRVGRGVRVGKVRRDGGEKGGGGVGGDDERREGGGGWGS